MIRGRNARSGRCLSRGFSAAAPFGSALIQRAIARQAVAEREKRAKIIHAEDEFAAARQLVDAAELMEQRPTSVQLRYLQTLIELATDRTSTVVFPVPVDTIESFLNHGRSPAGAVDSPPQPFDAKSRRH